MWLPVQHVLMLPFIWNDELFRTGVAGTIVSVTCFVASGLFIYLIAWRVSRQRTAGLVALVVFASNPNTLYMQSVPMTEIVLIATVTAGTYFLLRWATNPERLGDLVLAGMAAFVASMTRYEGWTFALAGVLFVLYVSLLRRMGRSSAEAHGFTYGLLALYGIPLWLLWNGIIFGSPLFFKSGNFSALSINVALKDSLGGQNPGAWGSIYVSTTDLLRAGYWNAGPIVMAIGFAGIAVWLLRERLKPSQAAVLLLAAPAVVQIYAMYSGDLFMLLPDRDGRVHNIRYGLLLLPLLAVGAGYLSRYHFVLKLAIVLLAIGQSVWMVSQGNVATYIDATKSLGGGSVVPLKEGGGPTSYLAGKPINDWFADSYDSGAILVDSFPNNQLFFSRIPTDRFLHEGVYKRWDESLAKPSRYADWIYVQKGTVLKDRVWDAIQADPSIIDDFTKVRERYGVAIYVSNRHYDDWVRHPANAKGFVKDTDWYREGYKKPSRATSSRIAITCRGWCSRSKTTRRC